MSDLIAVYGFDLARMPIDDPRHEYNIGVYHYEMGMAAKVMAERMFDKIDKDIFARYAKDGHPPPRAG